MSSSSAYPSRTHFVLSWRGVANAALRALAANSLSPAALVGEFVLPRASALIQYLKTESHPSMEFSSSKTSLLSEECSVAARGSVGLRRALVWLPNPEPRPPPSTM